MEYILLSFIAGIITVATPCVLPLLPVIISGSLKETKSKSRPFIIIGALAFSLVVFTYMLKVSTLLIDIDHRVWTFLSGFVLVILGIFTVFPEVWERISEKFKFGNSSNQVLSKVGTKKGIWGSVLTGLALGPVFSSCSPTYLYIIGVIIPERSFLTGFLNVIVYVFGLCLILLLVAVLGQRLVERIKWAANPDGYFRKIMGVIFVAVGMMIITGLDKKIETALVEANILNPAGIEESLQESLVEE